MKTTSAVYGVKLNDLKRDGSSVAEIFQTLKEHALDQLTIPDLRGPCDKAILVFDCANGGSIFAGALVPSDFSLSAQDLRSLKRSVDSWWGESSEAAEIKTALGLPAHAAPMFNTAVEESPTFEREPQPIGRSKPRF